MLTELQGGLHHPTAVRKAAAAGRARAGPNRDCVAGAGGAAQLRAACRATEAAACAGAGADAAASVGAHRSGAAAGWAPQSRPGESSGVRTWRDPWRWIRRHARTPCWEAIIIKAAPERALLQCT